ncbi:hypothetical protein BRADI_1g16044v3 [Brachypodium distachyon]|uniref:Reverse transcriptase zinc-binding domain-containing protein n=1 Tax=Brachypodium distachyon TaxID=15368 RepID=A0A2K2DJQ8_BRADI|nr:hypothetical protein BRADI_1g16044v3 [Brachypodium distachyon]
MIQNKASTVDRLAIKAIRCNPICSCRCHPETGIHLLAHYSSSSALWSLILQMLALPLSLALLFLEDWWLYSLSLLPIDRRKSWSVLIMLTWWHIWSERNSCVFKQKGHPVSFLLQRIKDLHDWKMANFSSVALLSWL